MQDALRNLYRDSLLSYCGRTALAGVSLDHAKAGCNSDPLFIILDPEASSKLKYLLTRLPLSLAIELTEVAKTTYTSSVDQDS